MVGRGGSQLRVVLDFRLSVLVLDFIPSSAAVTWRAWEASLRYCVTLQAVFVLSWLSWKVAPERFGLGLECKIA